MISGEILGFEFDRFESWRGNASLQTRSPNVSGYFWLLFDTGIPIRGAWSRK